MSDMQWIRCPTCGATNRVPQEKIEQGLEPVCGRCKTPLPISNKPVTVTDATFSAEVERSPLPVLLDLWAAWCAPCRMVAPVIDELAAEMAGRVRVAKLNVDENAERFERRMESEHIFARANSVLAARGLISADQVAAQGKPTEITLRYANQIGAELIVLAAPGARETVGARSVIDHATCAVLVARPLTAARLTETRSKP